VTGAVAGGPGVSVRAAAASDVPDIARIQLDTWRIAYAALLPPAVLAAATPERAGAEWTAAVVDPPSPGHRVLVAREQDWTVGFVAFGPAEEDDDPPGTGMLHTLLVEPRWGRRGHGSRLLAAAVDHLRGDGMIRAVVWLLDGDAASAAFYQSAGWARDGTVRTLAGDGRTLRETRFHVSLEEEEA
jgi:GNAT superfamily N-acetyltransferase